MKTPSSPSLVAASPSTTSPWRAAPFAAWFVLLWLGPALFVLPACGADKFWTGAVSDHWAEPGNWSPAGAPGNTDTAYFLNDNTVRRTIIMPSASLIIAIPVVSVQSVIFGGGGYTLHVPPGTLRGPQYSILSLAGGIYSASSDPRTNYVESAVTLRATQEFISVGTGVLVVSGAINLNGFNLGLATAPGYQWLTGIIYGEGQLIKRGPGLAFLGGPWANTFTGPTRVIGGELVLIKNPGVAAIAGDLYIDNAASSYNAVSLNAPDQITDTAVVHVGNNGSFIPLGYAETVGGLSMNANGLVDLRGSILTLAGDVDVLSQSSARIANGVLNLGAEERTFDVVGSSTLNVSATVVSAPTKAPGLRKIGAGRLLLAGANTYSGITLVQEGVLMASHNQALGDTDPSTGATIIAERGALQLGGISGLAEPVRFESASAANSAALFGSGVMQGEMIVNQSELLVGSSNPQDVLEVRAPISGTGGVRYDGLGTMILSGPASNTYAGMTRVTKGTLRLSKQPPARAIPGNLSVEGTGTLLANDIPDAPQLADAAEVFVDRNATWKSERHEERIRMLSGTGNVIVNDGRLTVGEGAEAPGTFAGSFSGNRAGHITKAGTGTWVLDYTGNNYADALFLGDLTVSGGTLESRKSLPNATATIASSALLTGYTMVSNLVVQSGGTAEPQTELGASKATFLPGSNLRVHLGNWHLSRRSTTLYANDSATISGANLLLSLDSPVTEHEDYYVFDLDGTPHINGVFAGLPEGARITLDGSVFQISYQANGGSAIILRAVQLPVRLAGVGVAGGNGSGQIDPDECNDLFISLTNLLDTPLEGMRGVLRTETPGLTITGPTANWPALAAHATGSNTLGFQVRAGAELPCGTMLSFLLVVSTPAHGEVTIPFTVATGRGLSPFRYHQSAAMALNSSNLRSTNLVTRFTTNLAKVSVSLYLQHSSISNLYVLLLNPRGQPVVLSYRNGPAADRFGSNCTPEEQQFIFDDDAPQFIQDSAGPYIGSMRPLNPLSTFSGMAATNVNGSWSLQVVTLDGPLNGTLYCWSLSLTPANCVPGGGACPSCLPPVSTNLAGVDYVPVPAFYGGNSPSVCGFPADCNEQNTLPQERRYRVHGFTNDGPETCLTATLQRPSPSELNAKLGCFAFLDHFDSTRPCANYAGDSGYGQRTSLPGFSFRVPAGGRFELVVIETEINSGTNTNYRLQVDGLGCGAPSLAIKPGLQPQTVNISWPATFPGWRLEPAPHIPSFSLPNETPTLHQGRYEVIHPASDSCSIFRLSR